MVRAHTVIDEMVSGRIPPSTGINRCYDLQQDDPTRKDPPTPKFNRAKVQYANQGGDIEWVFIAEESGQSRGVGCMTLRSPP
ncbi:hypothetical protein PHLCEN_2v41 [Hermanssonia centrifuga]|uniref:Uncharacterized protein n=1 Tax=Hermanssonia centrifuga TaxID=98765 RepID=A0A2R6S754_9APHY|nr:hypothetical protein PHLCEN_2v41 [Hermanssonia centrifuga]